MPNKKKSNSGVQHFFSIIQSKTLILFNQNSSNSTPEASSNNKTKINSIINNNNNSIGSNSGNSSNNSNNINSNSSTASVTTKKTIKFDKGWLADWLNCFFFRFNLIKISFFTKPLSKDGKKSFRHRRKENRFFCVSPTTWYRVCQQFDFFGHFWLLFDDNSFLGGGNRPV